MSITVTVSSDNGDVSAIVASGVIRAVPAAPAFPFRVGRGIP